MGDSDERCGAPVEKQREEGDNDAMREKDGLPVDTGWGWVISMCVFLNLTISVGYLRCLSVLFVDVTQEFEETATVVSLMFTISSLTACVSTILTSNLIMEHYSVRRISVISAIFNSLGTLLTSLAPSITVFLLLQIIKGAMFGCQLVCPMSLIGYYFKKRRNLALALANTGFCAAHIIFPPVTELLRVKFGMRGCLLLISAIELHLIAANLLLRPPQSYRNLYAYRMNLRSRCVSQTKPLLASCDQHSNNEVISKDRIGECREKESEISKGGKDDLVKCASNSNKEGVVEMTSDKELSVENGKLLFEMEINLAVPDGDSSSSDEKQETERRFDTKSECQSQEAINISGESERQTRSSPLASRNLRGPKTFINELHVSDVSHHESLIMSPAPHKDSLSSKANVDDTDQRWNSKLSQQERAIGAGKKSGIRSCVRKVFDFSLFNSWLFIMMILYVPFTSAINLLMMYMPVIALDRGVSLKDAALYMTISGIMDLIVRLVIGFVADLKCITKSKMVIGSLFILTVQCHTFRLFINKDTFIIFPIIVGIFGGFRQNLMVSMITDYVGVEKTAKGYAFCTMLTTFFISSNHPIVGALFDATGHFLLSLHYLGVCLLIGVLVLVCEPLFVYLQRKRQRRQKQQQQTD